MYFYCIKLVVNVANDDGAHNYEVMMRWEGFYTVYMSARKPQACACGSQ